jgi:hypothetical protein
MEELEPMEEITVDFFSLDGKNDLAMVDRASSFLRQETLGRTDLATVQEALMAWWTDVGRPRVVKTDGGPQFRGRFTE